MIDRSFADYTQMLRTPDLRLGDVRTKLLRVAAPFELRIDEPTRSVLVYLRRGSLSLEIENSPRPIVVLPQGTAVGFESGRAHRWRSLPQEAENQDGAIELFVSSIPRRMGVLQRLDEGVLILPESAEPYATKMRLAIELHLCEIDNPGPDGDGEIIRRCAEICLMQLVAYVRAGVQSQPDAPPGLARDENLLRAWSAYLADPRRRWTVQALANAAGMGRTAFAERFRSVFGAPPLQTLTDLRLEHAAGMLSQGRAPLIEIAFTVGYNSEAAFVRAFHRKYGEPPGRFRAARTPQQQT